MSQKPYQRNIEDDQYFLRFRTKFGREMAIAPGGQGDVIILIQPDVEDNHYADDIDLSENTLHVHPRQEFPESDTEYGNWIKIQINIATQKILNNFLTDKIQHAETRRAQDALRKRDFGHGG